MKDQLGFENNIGVNLGYSCHLDLGSGTLGLGLAFNFTNRSVDFSKAKPLNDSDPVIPTSLQSDTYLPLFEALDDSTRQPVTDDELQALYQSFLDSIHDGHSTFNIKNRHTGNYISIFPNVNRVYRERGDLLLDRKSVV